MSLDTNLAVNIPTEISSIFRIIEQAGGSVYLVGGAVRDLMLGTCATDWDLASDLPATVVSHLFPNSIPIGEQFGVVRIPLKEGAADIARMRIDGTYTDFRRPDSVANTTSIEEDLARRDFTVNGMAYHPQKGLVDPFGGQRDLSARMIRAIGRPEERFTEDPLRMLRAFRFCGQLGFDLALETYTSLQKEISLLDQLSMERKREEFEKLLVSAHAGKALRMCASAGALAMLFPQGFSETNVKDHAEVQRFLRSVDQTSADAKVRWLLFFCCFERKRAEQMARSWGMEAAIVKNLDTLLGFLTALCMIADDIVEMKRIMAPLGPEKLTFLAIMLKQVEVVFAEEGGLLSNRIRLFYSVLDQKEPLFLEELAVDGNDLQKAGIKPGQELGALLLELLHEVHKDPALNRKEFLLKRVKKSRGSFFSRLMKG